MWTQAGLGTCPPSACADCYKGGATKAGHGSLQVSAHQPLARAWGPRAPTWAPYGVLCGHPCLVPGQLVATRVSWLGSCSWRARSGDPGACTCCLGRSSAAWLASPASPPDGPREAQQCPAATPWPASPLGGQIDRPVRGILTPMLPHGRWELLGWGAQAGRPGAEPLACLHLQTPASPGSSPGPPPASSSNGEQTLAAPQLSGGGHGIMRVESLVFRRAQTLLGSGRQRRLKNRAEPVHAPLHGPPVLRDGGGKGLQIQLAAGCTGPAHGPQFCPGKVLRDLCLCQGCSHTTTSPPGQALPTGSDWSEGSEAHQGMRAKARPPQTLTGHVDGGTVLARGSREAASPWVQ